MTETDAPAKTGAEGTDEAGGQPAVTARLFAGLERLAGETGAERRVPAPAAPTVTALCAALGLDVGIVGLVLVNGVHADLATGLRAGDQVSLFPPVGGG
jgi:molybdopterin converting factor small subunit